MASLCSTKVIFRVVVGKYLAKLISLHIYYAVNISFWRKIFSSIDFQSASMQKF